MQKGKHAWQFGPLILYKVLLGCSLLLAFTACEVAWCQLPGNGADAGAGPAKPMSTTANALKGSLSSGSGPSGLDVEAAADWEDLPVYRISFEGVATDRLTPLPDHLAQRVGTPLSREKIAECLRQLFATGLFETIEAVASRDQNGITVIFKGTPRTFIGVVTVNGAKGATVNTQLERASRLSAGTRFTPEKLQRGIDQMRQVLADNGFHEPEINYSLTQHPEDQLVDVSFRVTSGPQARVGGVQVTGDSGMTIDEFRKKARLRDGTTVDRDTTNRALNGVLKHYRKQERLEAEIKIESRTYAAETNRSDFHFSANRGPVVKVRVEGAKLSGERLKRVIPIFEEGTVDEDLLNEGNRRVRDYYQRLGYFDVKVDHKQEAPEPDDVLIVYIVDLGPRRRVDHVSVDGNHYFDKATLEQLLSVQAANSFDRHGSYSQALVASDVNALVAVYQNNGFSKVKITPETLTGDIPNQEGSGPPLVRLSSEPLSVVYHIQEGEQQRVGQLSLDGVVKADQEKLLALMNTSPGQLLSPQNLAGDRDAILTDYLSRGFDQVRVEVEQQTEAADPGRVDVTFHIFEGEQIFVRQILLTGLHFTRPDTVAPAITLHSGEPLNQSALAQTQRNLYEFALFNEVNTAVENPNGGELYKTVMLQTAEARRWTLTYGLGFEAQTGQPQNNCAGILATGTPCTPNGKTGISPRGVFDVTRNNLFGREQSASLRSTYGLLEQNVNLLFQNPRFHGNRDLAFTISGGYANSRDVTTYVASRLETGVRLTQHFSQPTSFFSKANTFVYDYSFRRVKVSESSLQVGPSEIAAQAAAKRIAGPSITWLRDTRDWPVDAHRGNYISFQEFVSNSSFGAEAEFNRIDLSNSAFYGFAKGRFVLARNTRYGQERAYGPNDARLIPLPERLYSGGAFSHRGFSINAAGPRDPETGFPIGGAGALINSTEMRLPPPTLPFFGDALSFVLFEDMGNVFTNAGDAWASALRIEQPHRDLCKITTPPDYSTTPPTPPSPTGPTTSTGKQGICSFNYFSHATGLGARYHTPVGPIRFDFSYNLNPPIYPVNIDYGLSDPYSNRHVGQAGHFNFFFSLGQTF